MTSVMTPELYLKRAAIEVCIKWEQITAPDEYTPESIEKTWQVMVDAEVHYDSKNEVRCSGTGTNISPPFSRNYEADSVARCIDGVWIGWTYWYGGGKHGEPEAMEWMGDAYFLDLFSEETVTTVKRLFTKRKD